MSLVIAVLAFTLALEIIGAAVGMWILRERRAPDPVPARPRPARVPAARALVIR